MFARALTTRKPRSLARAASEVTAQADRDKSRPGRRPAYATYRESWVCAAQNSTARRSRPGSTRRSEWSCSAQSASRAGFRPRQPHDRMTDSDVRSTPPPRRPVCALHQHPGYARMRPHREARGLGRASVEGPAGGSRARRRAWDRLDSIDLRPVRAWHRARRRRGAHGNRIGERAGTSL